MRKFKKSERVIIDDGGILNGQRGYVLFAASPNHKLVLDKYPNLSISFHWSELVHEPTDGTVPVVHRAKSSGALKGWR